MSLGWQSENLFRKWLSGDLKIQVESRGRKLGISKDTAAFLHIYSCIRFRI